MNYTYDKAVGLKIGCLRTVKGLSQEQLCARVQTHGCDLTRNALAKIESGRRHIYAMELKAIKDVLQVSFEELFVPAPMMEEEVLRPIMRDNGASRLNRYQ